MFKLHVTLKVLILQLHAAAACSGLAAFRYLVGRNTGYVVSYSATYVEQRYGVSFGVNFKFRKRLGNLRKQA
jgi:hypothetical protein